jgi:CheY-like chemotaxis protein
VATKTPATQAKRILVVEDELMIRMLLEDMLGELGYTVAAEAARIEEALEATKNADFDLAILDGNLNGQPVSPVADALVARGTPFVFATGYGELPEPYRERPTLKKPFQMDGLKQMLQSALDSGGSQFFRAGGTPGKAKGAKRGRAAGPQMLRLPAKGHSGA